MSDTAMAKAYNPKTFEDDIYQHWMEEKVFSPNLSGKESFVIVIPPPNVTGVLHMGHGLNNTVQDILIRYHRMKGRRTLWVPGTDHAGIATQNVVEKRLKAKGVSKLDLGREKFIEETWRVANDHKATILRQLRKIGASCDWSRERFTLDDGLSRAVREVFVTLYERSMIYRSNYLINWCASCGTALSDDEVEHHELKGKMYHYRYPLEDGSGSIEIATTRPETMLGDTAVAVHPDDERYRDLVGKSVVLPLTDRKIPIVADSYVDMDFGTGAVKVTPAHDANDWEIGNRHGLQRINILNEDGTLSDAVPDKYRGMTVKAARKVVVSDIKEAGLFVREEDHVHQVGHCYRCQTVIEPYMSEQWFVRMRGMAEKALSAWHRGEIRFFPKHWENTYAHWLESIRDWCISRQLWWGHRIPVWYCRECGEMVVAREDPTECPKCGSELEQDTDVLDTWFSSWLWPFSTLGWPDETEDLRQFFPTTALVTAYDIIFFWVSRMIMASLEFLGKVPFRDIYITGLVRDIKGRKMSKSLGNGMDPLEIVDEFGADALKFTLAFMSMQGSDVLIEKESFRLGSKFANKIWNAARLILMNVEGRRIVPSSDLVLKDIDRWILHRLNRAVSRVDQALQSYRMDEAAQAVYEFFWNDFCDWYLEAQKISLYGDDEAEKDRSISLLVSLLEEALRLLHPFLSFITEEIRRKLPGIEGSIVVAPYPEYRPEREAQEIEEHFASLQELIRGVRTLRSEFTIPPERRVRLHVKLEPGFRSSSFFHDHEDLVFFLCNCERLTMSGEGGDTLGSVPVAGVGFEAFVFVRDVIDVPKQLAKLTKEATRLEGLISGSKKTLANTAFTENAPPAVVDKERSKLDELSERKIKITQYIADLT